MSRHLIAAMISCTVCTVLSTALVEAGPMKQCCQHDRRVQADFPGPPNPIAYRMKFEGTEIAEEGFKGWKYGLPMYGDDAFIITCNDLTTGKLKGKSDLEIIRTCFAGVGGIDNLVPINRKIGVAKTAGYEFTINYADGRRERIACVRMGDRFFRISASCIDSQPGMQPDPYASDFILSKEVDRFFDSFEILPVGK